MAATLFRYDGWAKDPLGRAMAGVQVYVCTQPANITNPPSPLATIYTAATGVPATSQPVTSDGFGHFFFYALPGLYTVVIINAGSIQEVLPDQSLGNVASGSGVSYPLLEHNGVPNGSQSILNLIAGSNISITDNGIGGLTFNVATPTTLLLEHNGTVNGSQTLLNLIGGTNTTITDNGSGGITIASSGMTISTAGTASPTPAYSPSEAPSLVNPAFYVQDVNGYWHAQAGMDVTTVMSTNQGTDGNPTVPQGVLVFDRMTYMRDNGASTQDGKNAFFSINHLAQVGTTYNNQDRAQWVTMGNLYGTVYQFSINSSNVVTFYTNNLTTTMYAVGALGFQVNQRIQMSGLTNTYLNGVPLSIDSVTTISGTGSAAFQVITASDSGFTHGQVSLTTDSGTMNQVMYSMANLQMEQDICGSPVFLSEVDSEVSTLSVQMSDTHLANNLAAPNYGCNAIRAEYYREFGAGTWGSINPSCIRAIVEDNATTGNSGQIVTAIRITANAEPSCPDNLAGLWIDAPGSGFTATPIWGIWLGNWGGSNAYAMYVTDGPTYLNGSLSCGNIYNASGTTTNVYTGLSNFGETINQFSTPTLNGSNFTVIGTAGSTHYTYVVVARDLNGNGVASASYTVTTGNSSLSGTNYIQCAFTPPTGCSSCELWRTVGGSTQGLIGTFTLASNAPNAVSFANAQTVINDTGQSATTGTLPVSNSTGSVVAQGSVLSGQGFGTSLVATSAITADVGTAVPVKMDTSNANQVVITTTSDTGAGLVVGVCINSPAASGKAHVITSGPVGMTLGTGTAAIGNWVIVDTTTNGRVKCSSSYPTAGTVIGVAMSAQSSVGSAFNVMVGLR